MKRKSRGQSLVEFAMIFPVIMTFLFASIDFGFYVFVWSETQFVARRGAERAATLPPAEVHPASVYHSAGYQALGDQCLSSIFHDALENRVSNVQAQNIFISFHTSSTDVSESNDQSRRTVGNVIQVRVEYSTAALTPVGDLFLGSPFEFEAISRRTIVATDPLQYGATGIDKCIP